MDEYKCKGKGMDRLSKDIAQKRARNFLHSARLIAVWRCVHVTPDLQCSHKTHDIDTKSWPLNTGWASDIVL